MTATRFLILAQSLAWTCREEPHRQHRSSRGKVDDVLTTPTWPHDVHSIRNIMVGMFPVDFGAEQTKRRPERASRSSFEHCSAHEEADADQEQHDDDEQGHGVALRRQRRERHQRAPVKEKGRPESRPRRPRRGQGLGQALPSPPASQLSTPPGAV
jgi:hypothetical protein